MRLKAARVFFGVGLVIIAIAILGNQFTFSWVQNYFYLWIWWGILITIDSWLYLRGGRSLFWDHPLEYLFTLLPASTIFWLVAEAFNWRLGNWSYVGLPRNIFLRWLGYFFSFATVLPIISTIANALEHWRIFPRNEFSAFFRTESNSYKLPQFLGAVLLALALIFPRYAYAGIWIAGIFLIDPLLARRGLPSFFEEWRQKNWNRTWQYLIVGLLVGLLWESLNGMATPRWFYHFWLPEWTHPELRFFAMPWVGMLGFFPFALECAVFQEWVLLHSRELPRRSLWLWRTAALLFSLFAFWNIDRFTWIY